MSALRHPTPNGSKAPFWHRPTEVEKGAYWHAYEGERGAAFCGQYLLVGFGLPKDLRRRLPRTVRCANCSREWRARRLP